MTLTRWMSNPLDLSTRPTPRRRERSARPRLDALDGRLVLSTLTVTNTNDNGPNSLRPVVAAARNGDTINFSSSLNGQTIALTTGELVLGLDWDLPPYPLKEPREARSVRVEVTAAKP
jgi:hypothetical protein